MRNLGRVALLCLGSLVGCAHAPATPKRDVLLPRPFPTHTPTSAEDTGPLVPVAHLEETPGLEYTLACPDGLAIEIDGRPDLGGSFVVTTEGRINHAALGYPRVEGLTIPQVGEMVAGLAGCAPGQVRCRVSEFRTRKLFVYGPINGPPRAVPWRGPETALALLDRLGGVRPRLAAQVDPGGARARHAVGQAGGLHHRGPRGEKARPGTDRRGLAAVRPDPPGGVAEVEPAQRLAAVGADAAGAVQVGVVNPAPAYRIAGCGV